tara:strand:+ start:76035 stop:77243 length:1209 start_codon:yes stop_codon:yes gene_type:complete
MAVGGRERTALRRHSREIGRDELSVDALAQHIGASAFENDDDEMRLRAADRRGGQGLGNRDQREIAAVAILVDPVAGNVQRERMAPGIERGRVDGPSGKAVTIAVEIARQCQPVGQCLPGDDPLQPARRIAAETRQHNHRAGEGKPHEGDCPPARPGRRQRRLSAEPSAQQACGKPPCREEEQQRAHAEHDLVLGEQQRIGRASAAQLFEQREADRVAEIGMQLVAQAQHQQADPAIEKGEMQHGRLRAGRARKPCRQLPGEQGKGNMREREAREEDCQFAARIDRTRLPEPAGEHTIFAIGDHQLRAGNKGGNQRDADCGFESSAEDTGQHGFSSVADAVAPQAGPYRLCESAQYARRPPSPDTALPHAVAARAAVLRLSRACAMSRAARAAGVARNRQFG